MIKLTKNEKGFTLIEVLIALAILGLIGVAFLSALATASKAIIIADERTTAESLARSQMEYVKDQLYIDYNIEGHLLYDEITPLPTNYTIDFTVESLLDPNPPNSPLVGIQKITVTVNHHGNEVLTLEDYKVDR